MTLNHSKSTTVNAIPKKEMHSRNTTVLINLLRFNVVHYSSLFQYFF